MIPVINFYLFTGIQKLWLNKAVLLFFAAFAKKSRFN